MLKLTVLDLSTRPASSSDSSVADRRRRSRPCDPTSPTANGCPASVRCRRRERRPGGWRARVAVPVLAVAAVASWPVDSHAQTNAAPEITSPGSKTYEQGEAISPFGVTVSDADGDPVTVTVTGLPSGLSYGNGQVQGTVSSSASAQSYTVRIRADDGVNAAVESTFTITVTAVVPPNAAPVIASPGSKTYEQGEAISPFGVTVSDADGDPVTVTVTGLPSGLSYGNGQVQGTVSSSASAQSYTVRIRADDGVNAAVESTFMITVTAAVPPNAAPVIASPGSKTYEQGEAISPFGVTVSDADGDPVTVTVTGLPSGLSYGNGQVQGTVSSSASAQSYTVRIRADDGVNAAVEGTFTITVTEKAAAVDPPNAAPVVTSPGSKTYEQGEAISPFGVTVSDADGDPVTVTLSGLPSGLSYANGQVQGTVSSSASAQSYTVTIRADDGVNAAVESTFTITVTVTEEATVVDPPNAAPVVTSPGDKTYEQGEAISPFGVTVSDADGDPVTVTVSGFPSGLSYANGQVQGTVSSSASAQSYTVTIRADDGVNAAVESTFTITVTVTEEATVVDPPNAAPVVTSPGSKTYEQGEAISPFGVTVSDADGDPVTVTLSGLPSGLSYANGQVQGTVSSSASAQAHTVTIRADDGVNAAVESTFTITVTEEEAAAADPPNAAPVVTSPGDKTYERGETITPFGVTVSDADGDPVTVTVSGLPSGLSYGNGQVQGTVADDAAAQDHTVTIQADDGGDVPAIETFTITVRAARARQGRDQTRPTVNITGPTGAQKGAFTVTITFSESVTGFAQADVTVGNGTVTSFAGTGSVATVIITPTASGTVTVDVAANVATDGGGDGNTAATRYSVEADLDAPTVTISGPTTSQSGPFDVTITFSEAVTGLEKAEVTVGNGTVTALSGSGSSYTVSIAPTVTGTVTVDVAAGVAVDGAGNANTAASRFSVSVSVSRPTTKIEAHGQAEDREGPFQVHVRFSGLVTGFELADVTVTNGQTGPLHVVIESSDYSQYWFMITPTATGTVTVDVAANVVVDEHGNGNTAASRLSVSVSVTRPSPVITAPTGVQTGPFDVTVTFSEPVTGFERSDIRVNEGADDGSPTAFSGSGATYTATITPTVVTGTVSLFVNRHAAVDADGNKSTSAVGVQVPVDRTVPAAPTLTRTRFNEPTNPALDVRWSAPAVGGDTITGYEARHRRSGGAWTNYAGALGASSTSFNLPDLVSGRNLRGPGALAEGRGPGPLVGTSGPDGRTRRRARRPIRRNTPRSPSVGRTPMKRSSGGTTRTRMVIRSPIRSNRWTPASSRPG